MPKKQTSDEVSAKSARLSGMAARGGAFWFVPSGWSYHFRMTRPVRREPSRVTEDVLSVCGSALAQDETKGKRRRVKK